MKIEEKMRYVILLFLTLLIFTKTFAAEYTVPRAAYSVYAEDLDLDLDKDIVVGHLTAWQNDNPTMSILKNEYNGTFSIFDTSFVFCGYQKNIFAQNIDNDNYPDIVTFMADFSSGIADRYVRIFYNEYGFFNIFADFTLNTSEVVSNITYGNIDNNNDIDIIVASNSGQFWGVLYNNGTGQFSEPEYHDVTGLHPTDLACGNLNDDNREDILVSGQGVRIYYSYESGFEYYIVNDDPEIRVEIADIDNDGDNDIVGLSEIFDIIALTIYENLGENNFYEHDQVIYEINTPYFKISDLNNDNLPDIVCSGTLGVYILFNEGDLQLSEPQYFPTNTSGLSRPPFCSDLDGNGYNDIITIRALFYTGILNILFNDGNGNFVEDPQVEISNYELQISKCKLSNYPNPFNPTTKISFTTESTENTEIEIFNVKGEKVKSLCAFPNPDLSGGTRCVVWDGTDQYHNPVSSGVYFYKLKVNGKDKSVRKCLLLK